MLGITLRGIGGIDEMMISSNRLENGDNFNYTLPANQKFSTYFEVITAKTKMNVSHDTFSKTVFIHCSIESCIVKCFSQQPLMSKSSQP